VSAARRFAYFATSFLRFSLRLIRASFDMAWARQFLNGN
jgi:hypothetical protein